MGIYSTIKEKSIVENYIDNNFLENCLTEEGIELHKKASSIKNEDCNWDKLCEMFEYISNSSLSDYSKLNIMKEAVNSMKRQTNYDDEHFGFVSESVILEYQGNPDKNKEFIECLKDLEQLLQFFLDSISHLDSSLQKLGNIAKDIIKSPKKYKDKLEECRNTVKEYNLWYEKAHKNINGQVTWGQFNKKIRKFNNKYSEVTMEEKKKLDLKLVSFVKDIDKIVTPWAKDGNKIKEAVKNIEKLEELDKDYVKTYYNIFDNFYDILLKEANATMSDISYTRKNLGIERENTFVYKAINKLLK